MNNITSNVAFHFWNSFNFLIVVLIIAMIIIKFGNRTKLIKATKISRLVYNWLAFVCGFACLIYFVFLRIKCGKLSGDIIWLFGGTCFILRGVLVHFSIKKFGPEAFPASIYTIIHTICLLVLISFLTINTMISINCFITPKKDVEYLIIHGAKTGSNILNNRIDTAKKFMNENSNVIAIASGGKGDDEQISEADYISNRLEEEGISQDYIIKENKSTTTYENLLFSKEYITENASFAVVTDDYHILRARLIAKKVYGYMPEGLPVHTSRVSLPHYILREYFSIILNSFKGNIL